MNKTNLYPATRLNAAFVEDRNDDLVRSGEEPKDPSRLGYFLIKDRLVPFVFLERLEEELDNSVIYEPGFVLSAEVIFGHLFLQSLDELERDVLMSCVLLVIERGGFPVNLFADI